MSSAEHGMGDVAYSSKEDTKLSFKNMRVKHKLNKVSADEPQMF
jgi:hypothetical protein